MTDRSLIYTKDQLAEQERTKAVGALSHIAQVLGSMVHHDPRSDAAGHIWEALEALHKTATDALDAERATWSR